MGVIYPHAVQRLLPGWESRRLIRPIGILGHTAVDHAGRSTLFHWFVESGLSTHFFILLDGTVEQYLPINRESDGCLNGNGYLLNIEHEDDAHPNGPFPPLTGAQVEATVALHDWCIRQPECSIPRRRMTSPYPDGGGGLGHHTMFGVATPRDPVTMWLTRTVGKDCPTPVRKRQFDDVIIPRLISGEPAASYTPGGIRRGDHGPLVAVWQGQLNLVNASNPLHVPLGIDGDFGEFTHDATVLFQRWCNDAYDLSSPITQFGVVDMQTSNLMNFTISLL